MLTALPLTVATGSANALQLQPLVTDHAAGLWPLIAENKTDLAQYLPWAAAVVDEQSTLSYLQSRINSEEPGAAWWLILQQGKYAGVLGLKAIRRLAMAELPAGPAQLANQPERQVAEIGYWLGAAFRGQQLMPQLLTALGTYLHQQQLAELLEFRCLADNHASIRLVTKVGAIDCGTLPHQLTGHFASQLMRRYLLWLSVND